MVEVDDDGAARRQAGLPAAGQRLGQRHRRHDRAGGARSAARCRPAPGPAAASQVRARLPLPETRPQDGGDR